MVDFEPKEGSQYGGTLITLYGWNFVDRPDENVVRIGATMGEQASQLCIVEDYHRGATVTDSVPQR